MQQLVKIILIFIGGIFLVSYLNDANLSGGTGFNSGTSGGISDRSTYNRSYDTNRDGVVSDEEFRQGELRRIADELEVLERAVTQAIENENKSPYADQVSLSASNARTTDRNREYLTISVRSNRDQTPINITGWRIVSLVSERSVTIGKGVALLQGTRPWRDEQDIFIGPGERALISTAGAPGIATGFLTNSCMGYFPRERFYPNITGRCPLIADADLSAHNLAFNDFRREREYDACMDAIENVRSCEIVRSPDRSLTSECRAFIRDYSNYDGCVELNKNKPDFYGKEWRIFLNISRDIWRAEREAIVLLDSNGGVVDLVRY